jgi:predicted extracellular nuclease
MKKRYFLLLTILMSLYSFGQATDLYFSKYGEGSSNNKFLEIYNGTGTAVDLSNYSIELYANGAATASNTQTFTAGTMIAAGDVYVLRNSGAALTAILNASDISSTVCNFNGDDAVALKKLGAVLDVIGQIGTDPGSSWPVAGTTVGTVDHTLIRKLSICSPNAVNLSSFGTDATNSEWIVYAIDGELGQLGSYAGCSSTPSLTISSPATATIFNPLTTSVNISLAISNFNVANGTGNGHIKYSINSGTAIMKYDTTPIAIPVTSGNSYTVAIELVNNSSQSLSPAVGVTVTFTVDTFVTVADLATLRAHVAANSAGKYYQVSSSPVVTYTRTTRNQKYVQDTSGGILIDDNVTAPGVITTSLTAGDAISGLKGQASLFNGFLQLLPLENVTVASSGNTVTPQVVTIAELNNATAILAGTYESELVQINGVTFDTTTANFPLSTDFAANINLTIGSDVLTFRTAFSEANYMGTAKPTSATNIIALVGRFNTTAQVTSRNLTDLNAPLSSSSFDNINGLTMYPNPVSGNTLYLTCTANAAMSVQIFDLLGKEVLKATVVNNAVNVSGLNAGVYMVKVTEEGKTATRKLVIQ